MIIYRPQRGNLEESLNQSVEFQSEIELKQYIVQESNNLISIEDIIISGEIIADNRTGWKDTKKVCIKKYGNEDYIKLYGAPQVIGFYATQY